MCKSFLFPTLSKQQHNIHILSGVFCSLGNPRPSRCHRSLYRVPRLVCFYGAEMNFKCLLQLLSKSTAGAQLSIKVFRPHPSSSHLLTAAKACPGKEPHGEGQHPSPASRTVSEQHRIRRDLRFRIESAPPAPPLAPAIQSRSSSCLHLPSPAHGPPKFSLCPYWRWGDRVETCALWSRLG